MNPVLGIGLAFAGIFLLTSVSKINTFRHLNILIQGLGVGWSGISPIIKITLRIQNPSNQGFIIKNIAGNFYLNGQYVGTMSSFEQKTIAASSQTDYTVEARLNLTQLVQDVIDVIQTKKFQATIRLSGNANVDNFIVPMDLTYKII